jgi:peroxiredoxin Q/BCP
MAKKKSKAKTKVKPKTKTKAKPKKTRKPVRAKGKPKTRPKPKAKPKATKVTPAAAPAKTPASLPDIELETTGGRRLNLSSLAGKNVVLYFYPKDDTPGCTTEGCDIRDRFAQFQRHDTVVLGVSRDSVASHEKFKSKFGFPFELVSDPDEKLCRRFDVIRKKSLYGREYMGVDRSTFVFDKQGKLRKEYRGVKVDGHADELLAVLNQL